MMNGEKIMSEHVWCHGPNCHTNHTVDRVRGSKGAKVLRTRKVQFNPDYINMYSYFCSNQCYNDFANKYIQQVIAIAPRREALETPIDRVEKIKHENEYHSWTETRVVPIE
jgi:YHS domain-containing protein